MARRAATFERVGTHRLTASMARDVGVGARSSPLAAAARPSPARARCCRTCSSSSPCWRWRSTGTCSPAMPGSSRSASRPSSGSAPTRSSPRSSTAASIRSSPSRLPGSWPASLAVPTALVVFRLQGAYFAIGTWVVAEVFRLVLAQVKPLGGGTGTSLPPDATALDRRHRPRSRELFGVRAPAARDIAHLLAGARARGGSIAAVYSVLRSRRGLALAAIRDSEAAAESVGVDIFRTKLLVYVATAFGTGMVGALIYLAEGAHLARRRLLACSTGPPTSSSSS